MKEQTTRLFRFFAEDGQARKKAIQEFVLSGQVDAVAREKNGETLLLLTSQLDTDPAGQILLNHCQERLEQACGAGLYGLGNTTLFESLVQAMQQHKMLFVAADTETRDLLNEPLSRLEQAGTVYDFGELSCGHEKIGSKIQQAAQAAATPLEAARKRISAACALTGANWGAASVTEQDALTLVVGNAKGYWVYPVQKDQRPVLWLADMLRRAALGAEQAQGVSFQPGQAEVPMFAEEPQAHRRRVKRVLAVSLAAILVISMLTLALAFWKTGGQSALFWDLTR